MPHTVRVAHPAEFRPSWFRHVWSRILGATIDRGHPDLAGCCGCGRPRVRVIAVYTDLDETWCGNCGPTGDVPRLVIEPAAVRMAWTDLDRLTADPITAIRAQHTHQEA